MPANDISIIASRVESLEGRLDDNIDKINGRLDQIVDLMQKVTALQEREINNQVQITEIKTNLKETNLTLKEWNSHLHERMDRHYTDLKVCRDGIDQSIKNMQDEIDIDVKEIKLGSNATQAELSKWLNRGIGAWVAASILIIILQGAGAYIINGMIEANDKNDIRLNIIEERMAKNERDFSSIARFADRQQSATELLTSPGR